MFTHLSPDGVQAPTLSWTVAEGEEIILYLLVHELIFKLK
jgi:hypothetical protein